MPASTKRRRSARDVEKEEREEEDLVASLFGGKKTRRDALQDVYESEDGAEGEAGPSSYRQNTEQYLDDDKVSSTVKRL